METGIDCLIDARCELGESPVWDAAANRLYWVDILAPAVHALDLTADRAAGRHQRWPMPRPVGSMALCSDGRLALALPDGVHLFDPATQTLTLLVDPEPDRPTNRLNDGKVGPDGAFWVGSMDDRPVKEAVAALYRVTGDGRAERKIGGLVVSNGLGWSADGRTMFHSDSRGPWIDRWDFDPATGAISGRRRLAELDSETGRPDGAAVDVEGCYWSCGVSAGCLNRFDPEGKLIDRIAMPVPAPTMCAFGGPDMRTLFVTSLRHGLDPAAVVRAPQSGGIHRLDAGVAGVPVGRFVLDDLQGGQA